MEERYISGEEHRAMMQQHRTPRKAKGVSLLSWVLITILVLGICGFGGFVYVRSNTGSANNQTIQGSGGSGDNSTITPNAGGGPTNQGGQSSPSKSTGGTPCLSAGPCRR
jgi:hypothetical protein